nr:hypothetical protein [Terrimicrobiaceae bacterium]
RSASFYDKERNRADLLARMGIDLGQALLLDATATNRFWISAPGRIVASAPSTLGPLTEQIVLSSGYTNNTNANVSADLNRPALIGNDRILDPGGTNFPIRWIYVQADGSYTNTTNAQSVGRFAFWIDDESTRVNLNTAAARSATNPNSWPSQVSLGALPGMSAFATAIAQSATNTPFSTPFEILGRNTAWTNALFTNRFFLTHYNQDPDVTPWDEPRTVLTTRQTNANDRPYLDVLGFPSSDPGSYGSLSATKLLGVYTNIVSPMTRNDWPYAMGGRFTTKFGAGGVCQTALDIIEYVRSAESTNLWPESIVAQLGTNSLVLLPGTSALDDAGLNTASIGTVRRPMITQIGLYGSTNTNSAGYIGTLHAQLYLPAGYNVPTNTFSGWSLWSQISSSAGGGEITSTNSLAPVVFSGGYAAITVTNMTIPATLPGAFPTNGIVRLALLKAPNPVLTNVLDVAPLAANARIPIGVISNRTVYSAVNDPRMNKNVANWQAVTNLAGDAPPPAHAPSYAVYGGSPASDGSTNGVFFPAPGAGVGSVGELGYVATGVASSPAAPWRSLRLRANSSSATNIPPDWALLDLFTAPLPARFLPGSNVTVGRVNLNALIQDGTNSSRTNVLNTLFTGVLTNSFAGNISNIINVRLLPGGNYGQVTNTTNFVSAGQLAEIQGIGDQGEAGEAVVSNVASLATVSGSVFTIYSRAQAIDVANGKIIINGEKIVRATVERYFDGGNVKFRTIYWSQIYP